MSLDRLLEARFNQNPHRHQGIDCDTYLKLVTLHQAKVEWMEKTGGEPDLYVLDTGWYIIDSSKESPSKRKNLCYDKAARLSRKKFPPESSVIETAEAMGINVCDEALYQALQSFEPHDLKTSSWVLTPEEVRELGGALFGDYRYGRVFFYHNGADSYYSSRGFRGYIKIK